MQVNSETLITISFTEAERDRLVDMLDNLPAAAGKGIPVTLTTSQVEFLDELMSEIRYV